MDEGPAYGYEMTQRLRERGLGIVGEGSIHPLLGRLEREGLVDTYRAVSNGGPPRKYYRPSRAGKVALGAGAPRGRPPRSIWEPAHRSTSVRGLVGRGPGHHPRRVRQRAPPSQAAHAGRLHRCYCADARRRGGPAHHQRAADRTVHVHAPLEHHPDSVRPAPTNNAAGVRDKRVCTGRMDPADGCGRRPRLRSMAMDDLEPLGIPHPPPRS
jgi:PadR family transcriptional regulator PadR